MCAYVECIAAGTYFERGVVGGVGMGHVTRVMRDMIQKRNFC